MTATGIAVSDRAPRGSYADSFVDLLWAGRRSWARVPEASPLHTDFAWNHWMFNLDERRTVKVELRIEEGRI